MSKVTSYLVERCCDGQVLDWVWVFCDGGQRSPRKALSLALTCGWKGDDHFNPEEDYFRIEDPEKAMWFWGYRDGRLVRLLRPPVSPGSLPPSP